MPTFPMCGQVKATNCPLYEGSVMISCRGRACSLVSSCPSETLVAAQKPHTALTPKLHAALTWYPLREVLNTTCERRGAGRGRPTDQRFPYEALAATPPASIPLLIMYSVANKDTQLAPRDPPRQSPCPWHRSWSRATQSHPVQSRELIVLIATGPGQGAAKQHGVPGSTWSGTVWQGNRARWAHLQHQPAVQGLPGLVG